MNRHEIHYVTIENPCKLGRYNESVKGNVRHLKFVIKHLIYRFNCFFMC